MTYSNNKNREANFHIFCKCGQALIITRQELGYSSVMARVEIGAKVEPCTRCIEAAKQTPEDWLPGFGAY